MKKTSKVDNYLDNNNEARCFFFPYSVNSKITLKFTQALLHLNKKSDKLIIIK